MMNTKLGFLKVLVIILVVFLAAWPFQYKSIRVYPVGTSQIGAAYVVKDGEVWCIVGTGEVYRKTIEFVELPTK